MLAKADSPDQWILSCVHRPVREQAHTVLHTNLIYPHACISRSIRVESIT
ncbi:hypothetical protein KPSA1_02080 [Pseudomonas syringae pv. actinidiae]|uniref:Uncharacterized protein n=1 Tax=Pseudomonas syringae pv. actinidiae TaxID=103796 RepID=A0A2V0Q7S1_PSESF|nr:hypothetical protein KPSA1_02080 [Pseudomonas syringae pv. actinidiae]